MRRFLPRSFFGQLFLGTILVQTLCLALFIWYTVVAQRKVAEERSRVRMSEDLNRLSEACLEPLTQHDMPLLRKVLELSRISPLIEGARLTDLAGKTFSVSDSERSHGLDAYESATLPVATRQQIFRIKNGQLEGVTPVLQHGKPVALLWLEPNRSASLNTIGMVVRIAATYGEFALLANLLPIFLIVRTMTRPLQRLREATNRVVRNPDLNAGFPLPVTSTNEAGELTISFNSMVRELEEQRRGLLETLALLDSMQSNAPVGFAFFDRELRYVRINGFLADLHGLPVEQHVGRRATDIYPEAVGKAKVEYLRRVFDTGLAIRDAELSGEMAHAPGVQRDWLMHFYPVLTQQDGIRWVGVIVVEITNRLLAEEALRKTEKLAAAGRLAASIAHEINNPLEAVTNLLYLISTQDSLDETVSGFVTTAQAELARVSEITQQTLRFYRQSTSPSWTNIVEVLNSIILLYQPRITGANVAVIRKFYGQPETFGFGGELRQLFANFIGNAIDAMPNGGSLWLKVRRGHGPRTDGMWVPGVRVSVADTGIGMSPETLQRIFEAFFTTKESTGTGLGLWVSDEIIRKHSGTVLVKSRQGERRGTCFLVFFPDAISTD